MDDKELARAVASDLGPEIAAAVENPPGAETVRGGLPEAMAVGGFVLSCAQLTWQIWNARQERELLVEALANSDKLLAVYPQLDPEKRMGLMARVLAKFLPDAFERSAHNRSTEAADKRRWVQDYQASRTATGRSDRDLLRREFQGGALILVSFADEDWWVLYQDVGWVPDAADGRAVVRVDVPRGFVSISRRSRATYGRSCRRPGITAMRAIYRDWLYWQQTTPREIADRVFDRAMHDWLVRIGAFAGALARKPSPYQPFIFTV